LKVTVFTTEDCGLCRDAERMVLALQKKICFEVDFVDICADPAVYNRYWDRVPVVAVDGNEVAAPLDEHRLKAILAP
jgi:glutaredoxin